MSLAHYLVPLAAAALVWWLGTGALVYLDHLPRRTFRWTFWASTGLGLVALVGIVASRGWEGPGGACAAFLSAFVVWGWQEASFYTGYVTGPRDVRCDEGCGGWRHFGHAVAASLYHELALLASALLIWWLTLGAVNTVAWWTFALLLAAHQSARLNVFLGVRNVTDSFLPAHLDHLRDFIGPDRGRNPLLPVSIAAFTGLTLALAYGAAVAATPFEATAASFLAATAGLAAAEHWVLALPLPVERLWAWSPDSRAR